MQGEHQVAVIDVQSWPDESDYIAADGKGSTWTWHVGIPLAAIDGAAFTATVEAALIVVEHSVFLGGVTMPFTSGLDAARLRQWARIKQTREVLNSLPITVDQITIDGDNASQQAIFRANVEMLRTGETERGWICFDNVKRPLTIDQIGALYAALDARKQALIDISAALRWQIFDPGKTTVAEVEAIVWPVAPPEPVEP
jgi:hypothetical protein